MKEDGAFFLIGPQPKPNRESPWFESHQYPYPPWPSGANMIRCARARVGSSFTPVGHWASRMDTLCWGLVLAEDHGEHDGEFFSEDD
jgi:hypothetical protein